MKKFFAKLFLILAILLLCLPAPIIGLGGYIYGEYIYTPKPTLEKLDDFLKSNNFPNNGRNIHLICNSGDYCEVFVSVDGSDVRKVEMHSGFLLNLYCGADRCLLLKKTQVSGENVQYLMTPLFSE